MDFGVLTNWASKGDGFVVCLLLLICFMLMIRYITKNVKRTDEKLKMHENDIKELNMYINNELKDIIVKNTNAFINFGTIIDRQTCSVKKLEEQIKDLGNNIQKIEEDVNVLKKK